MPCPQCGGSEAELIAPGYKECTSLIARDMQVDGGSAPDSPNVAPFGSELRLCGFRYHERDGGSIAGPAICACGTYAIGRCVECGIDVCGDHSTQVAGVGRLCSGDAHQRAEAAREEHDRASRVERERALEEREASGRDAHRAVEEFLRAMGSAGNPGAQDYWRDDPVKLSDTKFFTKPVWSGWVVGKVSWSAQDFSEGGSPTNNGKPYTTSADIVLTADGHWLASRGTNARGRKVADEVHLESGATRVSGGFQRGAKDLSEIVPNLTRIASELAVRF